MARVNTETISLIMGLSATMSSRKIEEYLNTQGIKLSYVTIGKIINEHRKERAEQTKEVINEYIKGGVVTDLEVLEEMRDQLREWFKSPGIRISERLMCADRLNKVIDTRLKNCGAGETDGKDVHINVNIVED